MSKLFSPQQLARHELLHLQFGYYWKHKMMLLTPEQLEHHVMLLADELGEVKDITGVGSDMNALAVVFSKASEPDVAHSYSLMKHHKAICRVLAEDYVTNHAIKALTLGGITITMEHVVDAEDVYNALLQGDKQ